MNIRTLLCLGFIALGVSLTVEATEKASTEKAPQTFRGAVLAVSDGDTVLVRRGSSGVSVSLAGVDAPEIGQDFAREARGFVHQILRKKKVTVEVVEWKNTRNAVGRIQVDDKDLGSLLVEAGLAWGRAEELQEAEQAARREKKGLWAAATPLPPWKFRQPSSATR